MSIGQFLIFIVVGILAGYFAGKFWKDPRFGLMGDLVVGMLGAFLGLLLFKLLGITGGDVLGFLLAAIIGSLLLLFLIRKFKKT